MAWYMSTSVKCRVGLMAFVLMGWLASAVAEDIPDTPGLTNIRRQGWVQFNLNCGRIVVTGSRGVDFRHSGSTTKGRGERLSVRVAGSEPVVTYEITTATQQFRLDASAGNQLLLRRLPEGEHSTLVPAEFSQKANEPITLKVGSKDHERVYRAPTIWHLFLQEPAAAREHLAPLLKILLREYDFADAAKEIESILVRMAQSGAPPDQKRWADWVQELGDPSFAKREEADRKLRESGRVVVTYLQQLDPGRLDAEQRYRVRRILLALSGARNEESPSQLATWLAGDPAAWLALLSREEELTRRLALKRLEAILGGPLAFDPDADLPTRQKQIEGIRARITGKQ